MHEIFGEPMIERLPKFVERIALPAYPVLSLNPSHGQSVTAFKEERLIRQKMQAEYRFDVYDYRRFFEGGELAEVQRSTIYRMCSIIERELEKIAKKGIKVYIHGEPETHVSDNEMYVIYEWSYKESDSTKMILKDGATDEALDKLFAECQQRVNREIYRMFNEALKKYK